jgi:SAM-dependent methyltransferase
MSKLSYIPADSAMTPQETGAAYDRIADWLDGAAPPEHGRPYLETLMELLPPGGHVLELGCGGGRWSEPLLENGFAVTGVDVSARLLESARKRCPRGEWVLADASEFVPSHPFDGILCWDSLFHLPHAKLAPLLRRLPAMLRPGGILLYTGGDVDGVIEGSMQGVRFTYAALSEPDTRRLLTGGGFDILRCGHDQPGEHHLVILARLAGRRP